MHLTETTARQLVDDRRASLTSTSRRPSLFRRTRRHRTALAGAPPVGGRSGAPPGTSASGDLAELVAELGIGRVERRIGRLVRDARAWGVEPLAVAVLADRWAPRAARERALGIVLVALAAAIAAPRPAATEAGAA